MHKYELLRLRAEEFRVILEEYAQKDSDVADFLERWMPWYERIKRREIRLPCYEYKLGIYFINPDLSPLADRYGIPNHPNRLFTAGTNFIAAMYDWFSDQKRLNRWRESGELPELIPDEPPPPGEEVPLPPKSNESKPTNAGKGWLYRWIFGKPA
jgi:hypothetical protein